VRVRLKERNRKAQFAKYRFKPVEGSSEKGSKSRIFEENIL
jgi:hypothetical protein